MKSFQKPPSDAESKAPGTPVLTLETFLPYRLNRLATAVSQTFARSYGDRFGIAVPEWRVMATIGQFRSVTARDICTHSHMHKTTVSRAVAALEARHFVQRAANRNDLREAFLTLTDAGQKVYDEIVPMATQFSEALSRPLDPAQRAMLDTLIDTLTARVEALSGGHAPPAGID